MIRSKPPPHKKINSGTRCRRTSRSLDMFKTKENWGFLSIEVSMPSVLARALWTIYNMASSSFPLGKSICYLGLSISLEKCKCLSRHNRSHPCALVDEAQPRIINSASSVAARESFTDPATRSKVRAPLKRTRNSREKSSGITKRTKTRCPQTPAPIRRSQRLNAGRRAA